MKAFYALLFFLAIILISNELANEGFNSGDIGKQVGIAIGVIVVGLFILMLLSGIR
jgi:DMSO/TMAO reductase YedYZ heme-binding membrane subunit